MLHAFTRYHATSNIQLIIVSFTINLPTCQSTCTQTPHLVLTLIQVIQSADMCSSMEITQSVGVWSSNLQLPNCHAKWNTSLAHMQSHNYHGWWLQSVKSTPNVNFWLSIVTMKQLNPSSKTRKQHHNWNTLWSTTTLYEKNMGFYSKYTTYPLKITSQTYVQNHSHTWPIRN
jgi:hypothetical protein